MPTDVNLVVLNGCRPTKSKPTCPPIKINHPPAHIKNADTIAVDSGASSIYFSATSPVDNLNTAAPKIRVGTASGRPYYSSASAQLDIPELPLYFPKSIHIILSFKHSMMGLGSIYDNECSVHFHKYTVTIYYLTGTPLAPWVARQI